MKATTAATAPATAWTKRRAGLAVATRRLRVQEVHGRADREKRVLLAHHRHQGGRAPSAINPPSDQASRTRSQVTTNNATAKAEVACDIGGATYM